MFPKGSFRTAASKPEEMGLHTTFRQVIASELASKGWSSTLHLPHLTWVGGELEGTEPALPSSSGESLFLAPTSSGQDFRGICPYTGWHLPLQWFLLYSYKGLYKVLPAGKYFEEIPPCSSLRVINSAGI